MRQFQTVGNEEFEGDSDEDLIARHLRSQQRFDEDGQMEDNQECEDPKGPLSGWLQQNKVIKYVRRMFTQFLRSYKDEKGQHVYEERIHNMCKDNRQSLIVDFTHLSSQCTTIAIWLAEEPTLVLPMLSAVAYEIVHEAYPNYY